MNKLREGVDSLIECDLVLKAAELCSIKYWLESSELEGEDDCRALDE